MDEASFRRVAGSFATGVSVVTTSLDGMLHGITVASLTSVSLAPLLLLVCIDKKACAHDQIDRAGRFGVSLLAFDQEAVSRTFATAGQPEEGRLRGIPFRTGTHGLPILGGALAHFECELASRCDGGDHTIFVARVLGGAVDREAPPLVHFRGAYGTFQPTPPGGKPPSW